MFAGVEMKSRLEVVGLQRGGKRFDIRRDVQVRSLSRIGVRSVQKIHYRINTRLVHVVTWRQVDGIRHAASD